MSFTISFGRSSMSHFAYDKVNWPEIFQQLEEGPRGTLTRLAQELGIDKSRLSRIWTEHRNNDNFDPSSLHWGGNNRTFTKEQEEKMVNFLIDGLANDGVAMPESAIKRITKDHWESEHHRETRNCSFHASNGWIYNFKNRNRLSGRISRRERKKDPEQEEIELFNKEMEEVRAMFPSDRIYNSDETPVKVAPTECFTTQRIGQPTPGVRRNACIKQTVTAVATIRANGEKLPLTVVGKGTTPTCLANLQLRDDIRRAFTASGKVNQDVAMQHIEQIAEWSHHEPSALVWDAYSAHATPAVWDCALSSRWILGSLVMSHRDTKQCYGKQMS